ncbi:MAG: Asp23/Gls24 family envelope stress response protein [Solirubrobacterales bacterium]|nr:MAG: Asp23/Gls24 family envelope stress response protein [Solirubrobacterales bacterium]
MAEQERKTSGGDDPAPGVGDADVSAPERGSTTIADVVVTKVASIATREVPGVYDLGGGVARAVGALSQRAGIGDPRGQGVGVAVEVGQREAAVDLTMVIEYGESIPQVSGAVRENVIKRVEGITGLSVTEVNIFVNDLHFPGDEVAAEPARVLE